MSAKFLFGAALGCAMLVTPAFAQTTAPAASQPAATASAQMAATGQWRASKLIGVNVYNEQNEKLGDINEVLLDKSGKATGVIIGVGGFLGMGEHDVMVGFDKLKWVNEPVRTTTGPPAATTGTATNPPARPARSATEMWYPDHAVLSATKDQLKAMQQFKYN
jgi:sporulation protein YlmC with PRC-barrel domain